MRTHARGKEQASSSSTSQRAQSSRASSLNAVDRSYVREALKRDSSGSAWDLESDLAWKRFGELPESNLTSTEASVSVEFRKISEELSERDSLSRETAERLVQLKAIEFLQDYNNRLKKNIGDIQASDPLEVLIAIRGLAVLSNKVKFSIHLAKNYIDELDSIATHALRNEHEAYQRLVKIENVIRRDSTVPLNARALDFDGWAYSLRSYVRAYSRELSSAIKTFRKQCEIKRTLLNSAYPFLAAVDTLDLEYTLYDTEVINKINSGFLKTIDSVNRVIKEISTGSSIHPFELPVAVDETMAELSDEHKKQLQEHVQTRQGEKLLMSFISSLAESAVVLIPVVGPGIVLAYNLGTTLLDVDQLIDQQSIANIAGDEANPLGVNDTTALDWAAVGLSAAGTLGDLKDFSKGMKGFARGASTPDIPDTPSVKGTSKPKARRGSVIFKDGKSYARVKRSTPEASEVVFEDGLYRYKKTGSICRSCNTDYYELNGGSWRLKAGKKIPRKAKEYRRQILDIDERLAVGEPNIPEAEKMRRALSLSNRQFLHFLPNQITKKNYTEMQPLHFPVHKPVSLKENPSAIVTHAFSDIEEMNIIGTHVVNNIIRREKFRSGAMTAQDVKRAINSEIWRIIRSSKGKSEVANAARIVRDVLSDFKLDEYVLVNHLE